MVIITERVRETVVKLDLVLDLESLPVARAALILELAEIVINNNRQEPIKEGVDSITRDLKVAIFTILERAKHGRRE
jgi:hypothetical protein